MKAFLVLDELNQFHWAMLKSVLLILALLPIAEVSLKLWLSTEGSSQIMIGFFALSIVSAWLMVSFTALKTSVWQTKQMASKYEQLLLKLIVMCRWFLSSLVAYLSLQLSIAF
ncbi:hypothetical protein AB3538_03270 [Acinetobacter baumannii]